MIRNLIKEDLTSLNLTNIDNGKIRFDLSFVNENDGKITSYVILRNLKRKRGMHWTMFNEEWDTVEFVCMNCIDFEEQCTFFMRILEATKYEHLFVWDANKDWNSFHKNMKIEKCRVCPEYYTYLMESGALLLNKEISRILDEYREYKENHI